MPTEYRFDDLDLREEAAAKPEAADWTTSICSISQPCTNTCNCGCTKDCQGLLRR